MRTRSLAIGVVAGAALVAAAATALAMHHGSAPAPAAQHRRAPATAAASPTPRPLSGAAKQLVDLLAAARGATFHATYAVSGFDTPAPGDSTTIELWRQPPLVRDDVVVAHAGRTVHNASLQLATGSFACTRLGDGAWTCKATATKQPAATDALVSEVTASLAGADVSVLDSTVAGRPARCYSIMRSTSTSQICVSAAGIPLAITAGPVQMRLIELSTGVAPSVFTLPGPVS